MLALWTHTLYAANEILATSEMLPFQSINIFTQFTKHPFDDSTIRRQRFESTKTKMLRQGYNGRNCALCYAMLLLLLLCMQDEMIHERERLTRTPRERKKEREREKGKNKSFKKVKW